MRSEVIKILRKIFQHVYRYFVRVCATRGWCLNNTIYTTLRYVDRISSTRQLSRLRTYSSYLYIAYQYPSLMMFVGSIIRLIRGRIQRKLVRRSKKDVADAYTRIYSRSWQYIVTGCPQRTRANHLRATVITFVKTISRTSHVWTRSNGVYSRKNTRSSSCAKVLR